MREKTEGSEKRRNCGSEAVGDYRLQTLRAVRKVQTEKCTQLLQISGVSQGTISGRDYTHISPWVTLPR